MYRYVLSRRCECVETESTSEKISVGRVYQMGRVGGLLAIGYYNAGLQWTTVINVSNGAGIGAVIGAVCLRRGLTVRMTAWRIDSQNTWCREANIRGTTSWLPVDRSIITKAHSIATEERASDASWFVVQHNAQNASLKFAHLEIRKENRHLAYRNRPSEADSMANWSCFGSTQRTAKSRPADLPP